MRQLSSIFTYKHVRRRPERGTRLVSTKYALGGWRVPAATDTTSYLPEARRAAWARLLALSTNRDAPPQDDADGGVGRERVQAVHTHATVTHITVEQRSGRLSVTVCAPFPRR